MFYLLPSEIALLAPQVAEDTALEGNGAFNYISAASATIDAYCGRSLEIRDVIDEQVFLDQDLGGKILKRPFVEWISDEVNLFKFGDSTRIGRLRMSDFSVHLKSGVIRNLNQSPSGATDQEFISEGGRYNSPYLRVLNDHHVANVMSVHQNTKPYFLITSYRAGFCTEKRVDVSGTVAGTTQITLTDDVVGLRVGDEFYFSTDPVSEPQTDHRLITSINTSTLVVEFTPSLASGLSGSVTLRKIDKRVRSACADIIADMIIYPPNTKDYSEGLGRGNLVNRWSRTNELPISYLAASKLSAFVSL